MTSGTRTSNPSMTMKSSHFGWKTKIFGSLSIIVPKDCERGSVNGNYNELQVHQIGLFLTASDVSIASYIDFRWAKERCPCGQNACCWSGDGPKAWGWNSCTSRKLQKHLAVDDAIQILVEDSLAGFSLVIAISSRNRVRERLNRWLRNGSHRWSWYVRGI